ncbi:MAG: hypothetical protein ACRDO9_11395, partial [Gaiellales bacterium]
MTVTPVDPDPGHPTDLDADLAELDADLTNLAALDAELEALDGELDAGMAALLEDTPAGPRLAALLNTIPVGGLDADAAVGYA